MNIDIIEYEDQYHDEFRKLNLEWLDKYNLTEEPDLLVLNDPRGTIINKGGYIWLAKHDSILSDRRRLSKSMTVCLNLQRCLSPESGEARE